MGHCQINFNAWKVSHVRCADFMWWRQWSITKNKGHLSTASAARDTFDWKKNSQSMAPTSSRAVIWAWRSRRENTACKDPEAAAHMSGERPPCRVQTKTYQHLIVLYKDEVDFSAIQVSTSSHTNDCGLAIGFVCHCELLYNVCMKSCDTCMVQPFIDTQGFSQGWHFIYVGKINVCCWLIPLLNNVSVANIQTMSMMWMMLGWCWF